MKIPRSTPAVPRANSVGLSNSGRLSPQKVSCLPDQRVCGTAPNDWCCPDSQNCGTITGRCLVGGA